MPRRRRRTQGHIEPRGRTPDGQPKWRIEVELPRSADGQRRRNRATIVGTSRQAEEALARMIANRADGLIAAERGTVADLAERWREARSHSWQPRTWEGHRRRLNLYVLPAIGRMRVADVTVDDLGRMYRAAARRGAAGKPLAPRSVAHIHGTVAALFGYAVETRQVTWSPATVAARQLPRDDSPGRANIDAGTVNRILASVDASPLKAPGVFMRLAAATGARPEELCALRWGDLELAADPPTVTFDEAVVAGGVDPATDQPAGLRVGPTKTRTARTVTVDAATAARLAAWRVYRAGRAGGGADTPAILQPEWFVFPRRGDRSGVEPMSPGSPGDTFARHARRLGMEGVTLYDLRGWHASRLADAGVHPSVVMHRLGHAEPATAMRHYIRVSAETDRAASELVARLLA